MTTGSNNNYERDLESLFKEAGMIGRGLAGARGFLGGFRQAGQAQELHRAQEVLSGAGKRVVRTPGQKPIKPMAPAETWTGRIRQRIETGREQIPVAQKAYDKEQRIAQRQQAAKRQAAREREAAERQAAREREAAETVQRSGYTVKDPAARRNSGKTPTPQPPMNPSQMGDAPQGGSPEPSGKSGRGLGLPLAGAAIGAGGMALYNGLRDANEQTARAQDYYNSAQHNLMAPMPSMTVTASHEKFAREKLANNPYMPMVLGNSQAAVAKSMADTIGQRLVGDPLSALSDTIKKRYFDEPKWQKNFEDVVTSDPHLHQLHKQEPLMLANAFETIKRFSPTLAKDRLATRSLLRHVAMSGGEMDFGTMKLLAETEKFHNESKRK